MSRRKSASATKTSSPQTPARAKPLRGADRGRQVVRLLSILRLLNGSRLGMTIQELCDALDDRCSLRTVYRDVQHLEQAGFPLVQDATRWSLDRSRTDGSEHFGPALRASDVLTLLLLEDLVSPLRESALFRSFDELRQRMLLQLTPVGRQWLADVRAQLRGSLAAPARLAEHASTLDLIEEASTTEQCLQFIYTPPLSEPRERVVEPHLLWYHAGSAYLVAYCRRRSDFRTFAVQRMSDVRLLEETFERRNEFDADTFTRYGFGVLHGKVHDIVVELGPEVAHLARERVYHHTQTIEELGDGGLRLSFHAAGLPEIASWLAGFGGKARAVAPDELVQAVQDLHHAGLAALGRSLPSPTPRPSAPQRGHLRSRPQPTPSGGAPRLLRK